MNHIVPIPLAKFYRLLNHGATTIISAKADGVENAMSASWVCALDYQPVPKLTAILDKSAYTRTLVEKSGYFAIQIPCTAQIDLVMKLGTQTRHTKPNKMDDVALFYQDGFDMPLVAGCVGYIICERIAEPHNEQAHDLFIGKVLSAWADERVFDGGHWLFDTAPDELKTLHYIAGGQFYQIGKGVVADVSLDTP